MAPFRGFVGVVAALQLATAPGCRSGSTRSNGGDADAATAIVPATSGASATGGAVTATEDSLSRDSGRDIGSSEAAAGDGGNRFRDAEPKVELDLSGPPDPACTGLEIAFASVVVDARCAIASTRAKNLRALLERDGVGGAAALRQEAKVAPGGRVAMRLVNTGRTSLTLPLSFHAKLPAFTAIAEDDQHTLYELEQPQLELGDPAQGNHPHFARIVLPPGGAAVATVAISPVIVRVLARGAGDTCKGGGVGAQADSGRCGATALPKGRYVLHVGQLLTDVEVGAPARVSWDLP